MKKKQIAISLAVLAAVMLVGGCSADNGNSSSIAETTPVPVTKAPETTVATTPASETKSPETKNPETTAPATKAPETTTTATTTTAKAPEWTEEKISTAAMYISVDSCYAREKAVLGAATAKLYYFADEVSVVAKTNTDYYKLKDGTFIHSDYLVSSKPQATTASTEKPKPQTTTATSKPTETAKPKSEPKYAPNGEKIDDEVAEHIDKVWTEKYYEKPKKAWSRCDLLAIRKYPVPYYGTIMEILYQLDELSIVGETDIGYAITSDGYYVYYEYIATEDNANYPFIATLKNKEAKY